ncbi:hypothetical protein ACWIGD_15145 [Streptomyces albidoflavus]
MQALVRTGGAGSRPHLQSPSPPGRFTVSEEGTQVPRPRTTVERPWHRRPRATVTTVERPWHRRRRRRRAAAPTRIEAAA